MEIRPSPHQHQRPKLPFSVSSPPPLKELLFLAGAEGLEPPDSPGEKRVLYQLSYAPTEKFI